jgi:4'-phosphopantetheinyl transferase EntD
MIGLQLPKRQMVAAGQLLFSAKKSCFTAGKA